MSSANAANTWQEMDGQRPAMDHMADAVRSVSLAATTMAVERNDLVGRMDRLEHEFQEERRRNEERFVTLLQAIQNLAGQLRQAGLIK